MEGKHFKVRIHAERHEFDYLCSTPSEAYDAIVDADTVFNLNIDMDMVMETLVDMVRGKSTRHSSHKLAIAIRDGEV